jgi:hypothetical protein
MQNENTPTEGRNSDKLQAESALRGAACCASSLLEAKAYMRKIFDGIPIRSVESGSCDQLCTGDSMDGGDALKQCLKAGVAEVGPALTQHDGKHLDSIVVQLLIPLLKLLRGSNGSCEPLQECMDGGNGNSPLLECRLNQMGLPELVVHNFLHNVRGLATATGSAPPIQVEVCHHPPTLTGGG